MMGNSNRHVLLGLNTSKMEKYTVLSIIHDYTWRPTMFRKSECPQVRMSSGVPPSEDAPKWGAERADSWKILSPSTVCLSYPMGTIRNDIKRRTVPLFPDSLQ